jgi:hypothetical protein
MARRGPILPLYHTPANLSSDFLKKYFFIFFLKRLDRSHLVCYNLITVKEREVITMRINFGNEVVGTPIRDISIGETFFAQRKSVKERNLYMKINETSNLVRNEYGYNYAIDLASGQLREFNCDTYVERVLAEVNVPKK